MKFNQLEFTDLSSEQLVETFGGKKKKKYNPFNSCTWKILNGIKTGSKYGPIGAGIGAGLGYWDCSEITAH